MSRSFIAALPVLLSVGAACGSSDDALGPTMDAGPLVCAPLPAAEKPAASCDVTVQPMPVPGVIQHVPQGSAVAYCSTPPANGNHYPVWAAFREYDKPLLWPNLVHSMEHGAILFLYKCDGGCPEIVEGLRRVRDALPVDPKCDGETVRRIIIAPAPDIDSKVAAASWTAIYKAPCLDAPSLDQFARDHYAKTNEDICSPGKIF